MESKELLPIETRRLMGQVRTYLKGDPCFLPGRWEFEEDQATVTVESLAPDGGPVNVGWIGMVLSYGNGDQVPVTHDAGAGLFSVHVKYPEMPAKGLHFTMDTRDPFDVVMEKCKVYGKRFIDSYMEFDPGSRLFRIKLAVGVEDDFILHSRAGKELGRGKFQEPDGAVDVNAQDRLEAVIQNILALGQEYVDTYMGFDQGARSFSIVDISQHSRLNHWRINNRDGQCMHLIAKSELIPA